MHHTNQPAGRLTRLGAQLSRAWSAYLGSFAALGIVEARCGDLSLYIRLARLARA